MKYSVRNTNSCDWKVSIVSTPEYVERHKLLPCQSHPGRPSDEHSQLYTKLHIHEGQVGLCPSLSGGTINFISEFGSLVPSTVGSTTTSPT